MDQGVRERAEARLRALFELDIAAAVAMVLKLRELHSGTVKGIYEFVDMATDEQWEMGMVIAQAQADCRCPNCNISADPPIMGKHVGIG